MDGTPYEKNVAGNRLKKLFTREHLRELVSEYRRQRDDIIVERQARAQNPVRLRELQEMMDAACQSVAEPLENVIWMKSDLFFFWICFGFIHIFLGFFGFFLIFRNCSCRCFFDAIVLLFDYGAIE